ncbi:hypothetical protein Tdes44962_MAKER04678 [Teratosphaeria destructans]|uniref:Uncharacterized protein n=1 Tax=Teratosphaeria destructans TaxID=418781 RepID=A0A9W7SLT6_9PEZI|nr:hypothetical protein Tdes44962_MAKER04678 [Teratosphaeria destructans]
MPERKVPHQNTERSQDGPKGEAHVDISHGVEKMVDIELGAEDLADGLVSLLLENGVLDAFLIPT